MLQKERIIAKICEMIEKNVAYATEDDFHKGYCASLEEIKDFVAAQDSDTSYNDLLTKVKSMYHKVVNPVFKHIISSYVPEVLAIDDDKIKNEIMVYLDWLDGKKECAPRGEYSIQQMVKYIRKNLNAAVEAEVQEKEKTIFEVGDYIVSNEKPRCCGYITRIQGEKYIVDNYMEIDGSSIKDYHLWSLKDVIDGDIIVSGQITLIFKKWAADNEYNNFVIAHAGVDNSGKVQVTDEHWLISDNAKPATEEQKDEFFKKLTECGYEWDFVKKTIYYEEF